MSDQPWVAPGSRPSGAPAASAPAPPPGYAQPPAPGYDRPPSPPPGAPYVAGLEFRPGIIALRPLTLGDLYSAVGKAIRGNVAATIGLAVLTSLACLVPTTALAGWLGSLESGDLASTDLGIGAAAQYVPALGSLLSSVALTGFLAYVIGQAVLGRRVSLGETWDGTRRRLPALLGAVLLGLVGSVLLLVVLVGPGVALFVQADGFDGVALAVTLLGVLGAVPASLFLWTRFGFATAVIVLEGRGVTGGFRRSWRLTSGSGFWRILGIRVLTAMVVGLAAQLVTLPLVIGGVLATFALGGEDRIFMWQAVLTGLASLVSGALTTPFSAGVDALLTVDERIRREGLDVQLIHAFQQGGPAPWPSAARTA